MPDLAAPIAGYALLVNSLAAGERSRIRILWVHSWWLRFDRLADG